MFERFTDRARRVMQLANQEAQRLKHEYIGTEHILLGLLKEGSGVAAEVFKSLDIGLDKVRRGIERISPSGPEANSSRRLSQTPRAKKVVEYAIEESRNLKANYVGSEHLLLGLVREEGSPAAQVLESLGLTLSVVRNRIITLLGLTPHQAVRIAEPPASAEPGTRTARAVESLEGLIKTFDEMKEEAVAATDFEFAALLRDHCDRLRKMREWLLREQHRLPTDRPSEDRS
jgi:ATP-dependent Clp protease ATP-binding subunit ClpC